MLRITTQVGCFFFVMLMLSACTNPVKQEKAEKIVILPTELVEYKAAVVAARGGDLEEAIELFNKVTRIKPDFSGAHVGLGLQYIQKKQLTRAESAFSKAIALDVANYVAYNHLGVIRRLRGDFTDARAMYQLAIRYNPNYANAHYNIAVLYDVYLYEFEQALYHYKKHQSLTGESDKLVGKWIVDLGRRMAVK